MAKGAGHARARPGHDARACSPPTPVVDAGRRSTRRCARRPRAPSTGSTPTAACPPTTPCCCWRQRRLRRRRPTDERARRGRHRGLRRPGPAAASPTPRARPRASPIEVIARGERGRRGRGRPGGRPQQPAQVRHPRRGPQLGPGPGRGRHHRRRLRARRASTSRSTGSGSAATAPRPRTAPRSTCPAARRHDHRRPRTPATPTATVWTNDLTAAYVHENSAYST